MLDFLKKSMSRTVGLFSAEGQPIPVENSEPSQLNPEVSNGEPVNHLDISSEFEISKFANHEQNVITTSDECYQRLENGHWLNDEIVNHYAKHLCSQGAEQIAMINSLETGASRPIFARIFEGKNQVKKNKIINRYKDKEVIFFPWNINGNHWVLYVYCNTVQPSLYYIDSFNQSPNDADINKIQNFLINIQQDVFDLLMVESIKVPHQNNLNDCGVAVCFFMSLICSEGIDGVKQFNSTHEFPYESFRETLKDIFVTPQALPLVIGASSGDKASQEVVEDVLKQADTTMSHQIAKTGKRKREEKGSAMIDLTSEVEMSDNKKPRLKNRK